MVKKAYKSKYKKRGMCVASVVMPEALWRRVRAQARRVSSDEPYNTSASQWVVEAILEKLGDKLNDENSPRKNRK